MAPLSRAPPPYRTPRAPPAVTHSSAGFTVPPLCPERLSFYVASLVLPPDRCVPRIQTPLSNALPHVAALESAGSPSRAAATWQIVVRRRLPHIHTPPVPCAGIELAASPLTHRLAAATQGSAAHLVALLSDHPRPPCLLPRRARRLGEADRGQPASTSVTREGAWCRGDRASLGHPIRRPGGA